MKKDHFFSNGTFSAKCNSTTMVGPVVPLTYMGDQLIVVIIRNSIIMLDMEVHIFMRVYLPVIRNSTTMLAMGVLLIIIMGVQLIVVIIRNSTTMVGPVVPLTYMGGQLIVVIIRNSIIMLNMEVHIFMGVYLPVIRNSTTMLAMGVLLIIIM
jgi:hypothetical protein